MLKKYSKLLINLLLIKWVIEFHDIWGNSHAILHILEKFSRNGFYINFDQIHKDSNVALLYAKRK